MPDPNTALQRENERLRRAVNELSILNELATAIGAARDLKGVIHTIVQLGAAFGMSTVAEGVETQEELDMLLAAGCPEAQGYLFNEPVPSGQVFDIIRADELGASKVA